MGTADSTVCALVPMYPLLTTTCGGARSGNSAIGRVGMGMAPAMIMNSAHTVAKTGRRMKKSTNKAGVHLRWEQCRANHGSEVPNGQKRSFRRFGFVP